MSRHFYDIFRLFQLSEFTAALTDLHFINDIIAHRKSYSRLRHFDYSSLRIGHIQIIPPEKIITALKTDYDEMATEMIYGRPPTFPDLIDTAGKIQDLINQKM